MRDRLQKYVGYLNVYEVKSFLISLFPTAATLALQLGTFVLIGRGLGAAEFGEYSAITAVTSVFVEFIACGSGDILVRGIILRPERYSIYFGSAVILLAVSFPITAFLAFLIAHNALHIVVAVAPLVLFLCSELISSRLLSTAEMLSNAKRDIIGANAMRVLLIGSRFVLAIFMFELMRIGTLSGWLLACVCQSTIISVICFIYLVGRYGRPKWKLVNADELKTGLLFCVAQTARASQGNVDRAFLAAFSMGPVLGSYAAASRMTQLGLFPIQIVNRILYPQFFAHGAKGIHHGRRFAIKCAPLLAAVGAASGCAVAAVGYIIPELLGHGFAQARPFAAALALAVPITAIQYPAADALTGSGRQSIRTIIYVVAAVGFGLLLVTGAAIGRAAGVTVAYIVGQILFAAVLWTMLLVQKDPEGLEEAAQ